MRVRDIAAGEMCCGRDASRARDSESAASRGDEPRPERPGASRGVMCVMCTTQSSRLEAVLALVLDDL